MEDHTTLVKLMAEKATAVQTKVSKVRDLREALRYAVELTIAMGGSAIAAPGLSGSDLEPLAGLCAEKGIDLLTNNLRDEIGRMQTAFTVAEWGVAETATLVQVSSSEDVRIATMLSETHVAVLPCSRIHPDMASLEEELALVMKTPPSYLAFISGASRTADIERVLTIGVHGPQELHILLLDDRP